MWYILKQQTEHITHIILSTLCEQDFKINNTSTKVMVQYEVCFCTIKPTHFLFSLILAADLYKYSKHRYIYIAL